MLNYSSVVIPVTKADKTIDIVDEAHEPWNDDDKKNWEACKFIAFGYTILNTESHLLIRPRD